MLTERFEQLGLECLELLGSILVVMRPEEFTDKGVSTRFTVLLNIAVLPHMKNISSPHYYLTS